MNDLVIEILVGVLQIVGHAIMGTLYTYVPWTAGIEWRKDGRPRDAGEWLLLWLQILGACLLGATAWAMAYSKNGHAPPPERCLGAYLGLVALASGCWRHGWANTSVPASDSGQIVKSGSCPPG